jgi:2-succinyl-5-enolpyruvyl-6-hydroxy-3-cyclohexene-1-carboxylate synthase
MITTKQNAIELVALLKQYGIDHVVISAGSRHIPFAVTMENDSFFKCFSVIDERSAAYFALGLIMKLQKPVAICCTSGTAALNYHPAIAEAFYQKLPLVVITGDKPTRFLNQNTGQMVPQAYIFKDITKYSVDVPECKVESDRMYVNRLINEALLELDHHGKGPVHINIHESAPLDSFSDGTVPVVRKITRYSVMKLDEQSCKHIISELKNKKILIFFGQQPPQDEEKILLLNKFISIYKPVIIADNISNLSDSPVFLNSNIIFSKISHLQIKNYSPDILITFGGELVSNEVLKLVTSVNSVINWYISEDGSVRDQFNNLTNVFEGCLFDWISMILKYSDFSSEDLRINNCYFNDWKSVIFKKTEIDVFSDLYCIQRFMTQIPLDSVLYLGNSNAIRFSQFFQSNRMTFFCNRGTSGIDGSLSTAAGYASISKEIIYVIIGDLSFFYDSNAMWNQYFSTNLRILLINNSIGGLLHNTWKKNIPNAQSKLYGTNTFSAEGICKTFNIQYFSASSISEYEEKLPLFMDISNKTSIIFEVFSDYKVNEQVYKDFILNDISFDRQIYNSFKTIIKR